MLTQVKEQLKSSAVISAQFLESVAERNVKFTEHVLESGLDSVKKMHSGKSLGGALSAHFDFLKGLQHELISLGKNNTLALKEFGKANGQLLKGGFRLGKKETSVTTELSVPKAEPVIAAVKPAKKKAAADIS